jgi:peroxiredoxin
MNESPDPTSTPRTSFPFHLLLFALGALVFGIGIALLILAPQQAPNTSELPIVRAERARVGRPAPAFSIQTLGDAQPFTIEALRGNTVLINFWASWCTPCIEETPALVAAFNEIDDPGVRFIGIGVQDSADKLTAFAAEYKLSYPIAQDTDGRIADAYGVVGLPMTVLVDREGIIRKVWPGAVTRDQVLKEIRALPR